MAVGFSKSLRDHLVPPTNTGLWSPPELLKTQNSLPKAAAQLLASRFPYFYRRTPPSAPACQIPQPGLREHICSTYSLNFYLKLLLFPGPAGRRGPVPLIPCLLIAHVSRVFFSTPTSSILYFLRKRLGKRRSGPTRYQTPGPPRPTFRAPTGWMVGPGVSRRIGHPQQTDLSQIAVRLPSFACRNAPHPHSRRSGLIGTPSPASWYSVLSRTSPPGSQKGCRRQGWHTAGWVGAGSQLGPAGRDLGAQLAPSASGGTLQGPLRNCLWLQGLHCGGHAVVPTFDPNPSTHTARTSSVQGLGRPTPPGAHWSGVAVTPTWQAFHGSNGTHGNTS